MRFLILKNVFFYFDHRVNYKIMELQVSEARCCFTTSGRTWTRVQKAYILGSLFELSSDLDLGLKPPQPGGSTNRFSVLLPSSLPEVGSKIQLLKRCGFVIYN
jgi:hypothetical protein